ncbi:MAG TPA: peptidoglycan recognition protein, partial [Gaiellaceae bacterium]|nr:peptidoglycan recognition protein [Gaiellaceae bacterium]
GERAPAASVALPRFTLVGVHWRGPGRVYLRTRSLAGRWSPWRPAAPEDEDGPDPGAPEARRRAGWRLGNPWWVGPSDRLETRTVGRVGRIRAYLVWSPPSLVPYRVPAATETPAIVPRALWGADESIRRQPPVYAPALRFAVVHHTAGRNDYTRAEAAAIVRGIQLFHVQGNGWNDIGYNFLVDRFGTIYEGRYGGIEQNVVGAHAQGFNTGSVGVAVLGTYGQAAPSQAAQDALARLLAWRLDLAHVDPLGVLTVLSGGNERYAPGVPVSLRAVSGHRDTGFTECPGAALYGRLGAIAGSAAAQGGPKVYEPFAEPSEDGYRFRARLSAPLPWAVVVRDATGAEVARGTGRGRDVDWFWSTVGLSPGTYAWAIEAGAARPATGSVQVAGTVAAALAVEEAVVEPAAISPDGDGQADAATVAFRLTRSANVTVEVVDGADASVATAVDRVWLRAGRRTAAIDGTALPDGVYRVRVTARLASGEEARAEAPLAVTRTLGTVAVSPPLFSPNGDGRLDRLAVTFPLAAPAEVRLRILREGRWVATPFAGTLFAGPQRLVWDGARATGSLRDGSYEAVVEVTDAVGTLAVGVPFVVDTTAPRVRILPGRPLRIEVDEPAALVLRVDGAILRRRVAAPGIVRIPWRAPAARVRVVAWDAAGNASPPAVRVERPGAATAGK